MCGIAGFARFRPAEPDGDLLSRMVGSLAHRGPDDEGRHVEADVAFGHRRLSIIDLSEAAHQPMTNADGSIWIVFNGEIYNYVELQAELEAKGYRYRSRSDTETIIHAYEAWGTSCVTRFNGMFAFALWDARQHRLFCARDLFGEKPFYYARHDDRFVFASEIKAVLQDPRVNREPDPEILRRYLDGNLTDVDARTFFKGVRMLPPAHTLTVEAGRVSIARYWSLPESQPGDATRSETTWVEEFRETLKDSIRLRLRSDVQVGTCLSGGLDSSTIVCLLNQIVPEPMAVFSVVYDEPGFEEGVFIKAVTDVFRMNAHRVTPTGDDLYPTIGRLIWHNDEPSSSYGMYSQWQVMKLASEHGVKVILNGQGGDELLAGYQRYVPTYLRELLRQGRFRTFAREARASEHLHDSSARESIKQALYPMVPAFLRELYRRGLTHRQRPDDFVSDDLRRAANGAGLTDLDDFPNLASHLACDLTVTSVPALVHHEDRASMAFGHEIRLPFLDPRLVEIAMRMPASLKIRDGVRKYVLRRAMETEGLPEAVLSRYDKKGYPTPICKWFRTTARELTRDVLWSQSFRERGLVQVDRAQRAFERHVAGEADFTLQIWQWVNVELWYRQFVDRTADAVVA
jgi:asparagine synthase (glutamine-hydrolysing)